MQIIQASFTIPGGINAADIYKKIEQAGRTCYKSEDRITEDSAKRFVTNLVKNHHEAMLEHASMTVIFTVDRGVSHELVRHRVASFAQESTRYCNYSKDKFGGEITVIEPSWAKDISEEIKTRLWGEYDSGSLPIMIDPENKIYSQLAKNYSEWLYSCQTAERAYFSMLERGMTPQDARCVLPMSLKTEAVVTANMREWRHILSLRAAGTTGNPHPDMAAIMIPLLEEFNKEMPELFGDIWAMIENDDGE